MDGVRSPEPVIAFHRAGTRAILLAVSGGAAGVAITVWVTLVLIRMPSRDLERLSDAGQAFGILSGLLSSAALAGVVASVAYQSRQNRSYRFETWHTAQANLLFRVMDEPAVYGPCIVDPGRFESDEEMRRYFFTTLWLNFGQIGLRSGNFTEESIREELCGDMFASPVARDLWAKRRAIEIQNYGGLSPFRQMLDEEFRKAERQKAQEDAADANTVERS